MPTDPATLTTPAEPAVAFELDNPKKVKEAFDNFRKPDGALPEVKEGAFGAAYKAKRNGAAVSLNPETEELSGIGRSAQKLQDIKNLASNGEMYKEVADTFRELGHNERDIEKLLASSARDMQRQAGSIGRDLTRSIKDHSDALVKLTKGQAKITKEYARTVLKSEFDAIKKLAPELQTEAAAKLERDVVEFTDHLKEVFQKNIDHHKDSIQGIRDFVAEMGEKGVKIEIGAANAAETAKATATVAEEAAHAHPPVPQPSKFKAGALGVGGAVMAADGIMNLTNGEEKSGMEMGVRGAETAVGGYLALKNLPKLFQTAIESKVVQAAAHAR